MDRQLDRQTVPIYTTQKDNYYSELTNTCPKMLIHIKRELAKIHVHYIIIMFVYLRNLSECKFSHASES